MHAHTSYTRVTRYYLSLFPSFLDFLSVFVLIFFLCLSETDKKLSGWEFRRAEKSAGRDSIAEFGSDEGPPEKSVLWPWRMSGPYRAPYGFRYDAYNILVLLARMCFPQYVSFFPYFIYYIVVFIYFFFFKLVRPRGEGYEEKTATHMRYGVRLYIIDSSAVYPPE